MDDLETKLAAVLDRTILIGGDGVDEDYLPRAAAREELMRILRREGAGEAGAAFLADELLRSLEETQDGLLSFLKRARGPAPLA